MALTTSEQIQQQMSIIFGFSNGKGIEVGDIIGIGKLSESRVKALIDEMLLYLSGFNAMLRDYAGSEIYAIEFELERVDADKTSLDILPQGMLFVPGEYKECTSLLLLLSNELSLLDNSKAHDDLEEISRRFFEIEEIVERPEFTDSQKSQILTKFSRRFSRWLQAAAIEHKWDKKLIGLKESDEKEQINRRLILNIPRRLRFLNNNAVEIILENARVTEIKLNIHPQDAWETFKYTIQASSIEFILKNAMKLTTKLTEISNIGTINDNEFEIVMKIMDYIAQEFSKEEGAKSVKWSIDEIQKINVQFTDALNYHNILYSNFSKTILNKSLEQILSEYDSVINSSDFNYSNILKFIADICRKYMENTTYQNKNMVLLNEISPTVNYVESMVKHAWKSIKQAIPKYFYLHIMKQYNPALIERLSAVLNSQDNKLFKEMGLVIIKYYADILNNYINESLVKLPPGFELKEANVLEKFIHFARESLESVLSSVKFNIKDIVELCQVELGESSLVIKEHLEKFERFEPELNYLLAYIMRYTSFNIFIQNIPEDKLYTPISFSEEFSEFLRKKMGALSIKWKEYILTLIKGFGPFFQTEYDQAVKKRKVWTNHEIIQRFIKYINDMVKLETNITGFRDFLDKYSKNVLDMKQNFGLRDLKANYSEILTQQEPFFNFVKNVIGKELDTFGFRLRPVPPINFIKASEVEMKTEISFKNLEESEQEAEIKTLVDYLKYRQLPYYSRLMAKPKYIVLKSKEQGNYFSDLIKHDLELSYFEHSVKCNYSNNYLVVKPKFK